MDSFRVAYGPPGGSRADSSAFSINVVFSSRKLFAWQKMFDVSSQDMDDAVMDTVYLEYEP